MASPTELEHNKLGVKIDSSFNFNFSQLKPISLALCLPITFSSAFSLSLSVCLFDPTTFVLLLNVAQFCFYVEKKSSRRNVKRRQFPWKKKEKLSIKSSDELFSHLFNESKRLAHNVAIWLIKWVKLIFGRACIVCVGDI